MVTVKILFFANLRELTDEKTIEIAIPDGTTVEKLIRLLIKEYPKLGNVQGSMIASINREYASSDKILSTDAEVAFFPPVSGG